MTTFLNIIFLIIGLLLLIKGADMFVTGAVSIAKKLKIPTILIGLTIVSIGTSLPELSISLVSAFSNSVDLSIGNVIGSCLFNMLVILGVTCLVVPVPVEKSSKKLDLPFLLVLILTLTIFSLDKIINNDSQNVISRSEGLIFIAMLIFYLITSIKNVRNSKNENIGSQQELNSSNEKLLKYWQILLNLFLGIIAIAFGGECVSSTAQYLAIKLGMSETLIGVTIVALGTSLPELVTSIIAAKKGEVQLAVGNVIGSNIMNIALILGFVGTLVQIPISSVMIIDILILCITTFIFVIISLKKEYLNKKIGVLLLSLYFIYMIYAIIRNYA